MRVAGQCRHLAIATLATLALAGCGTSANETLVKEAGVHGDALEKVYNLYNQDAISNASSRDLKDVKRALQAKDLKQATPGDVRRAEDELRSRIDALTEFITKIKAANKELKGTPLPNLAAGLDDSFANNEFDVAYRDATKTVERYTTTDLAATHYVFTSLEKYLNFLERWELFVTNGATAGLVSTGQASDKAFSRLGSVGRRLDKRVSLPKTIKPLVDRMAAAASDSDQLASLVNAVKKQYPESFVAVHAVGKS